MIYLVELTNDNESILKLGYTSKTTTEERFRGYHAVFKKVHLLYTFKQDAERDLKSLEKDLNNTLLQDYKLETVTDFAGKTECYSLKDLNTVLESINKYINDARYDIKPVPVKTVPSGWCEVLRLLVPNLLPMQVEYYLCELFDGNLTRKNLTQIRVRRNKERKTVEASHILTALHLHTIVTDYMKRVDKL